MTLRYGVSNKKTFEHIVRRGAVLRNERIVNHKKQLVAAAEYQERLESLYKTFLQADGSLKHPISDTPTEEERSRAAWFDALPKFFQRIYWLIVEGLLTEDVDKINEYLSSLSPEESEVSAKMAIDSGFIQFETEGGDEDGDDKALME